MPRKPTPTVVISKRHLEPTTTEQEDITTAGQRRVNLIWEFTQALIAVTCTASLIYCSIKGIQAAELKNAFFLIIGFYFSRTNHQAIGEVGKKPDSSKYTGR